MKRVPNEELAVSVTQHGPNEYSWCLVSRPSASALASCVLQSTERFACYELAVDAGFRALKELCAQLRAALRQCCGDRASSG